MRSPTCISIKFIHCILIRCILIRIMWKHNDKICYRILICSFVFILYQKRCWIIWRNIKPSIFMKRWKEEQEHHIFRVQLPISYKKSSSSSRSWVLKIKCENLFKLIDKPLPSFINLIIVVFVDRITTWDQTTTCFTYYINGIIRLRKGRYFVKLVVRNKVCFKYPAEAWWTFIKLIACFSDFWS